MSRDGIEPILDKCVTFDIYIFILRLNKVLNKLVSGVVLGGGGLRLQLLSSVGVSVI